MSAEKSGIVLGWVVCPEPGTETGEKLAIDLAKAAEIYEAEHSFVDSRGVRREGYWCSDRGHGFVEQAQKFCDSNPWAKVRIFKKVSGLKKDRYVEFSFRKLRGSNRRKKITTWLKERGR